LCLGIPVFLFRFSVVVFTVLVCVSTPYDIRRTTESPNDVFWYPRR
jgi:hypothetical protein